MENLTAEKGNDDREIDRLERLVHEMQVYRCEPEMQNRALQESQEQIERAAYRYTELYDSLPIGYVTLTPAGQVTEVNAAACDALHLTREQLKGAFFRKFIASDDASAFAAHLAACNRSSTRQIMETTLSPRNGPPFAVQLSSCRTFPAAEVGFMIRTAFTDITDNRRVQKALQESLAEHDEFAYSISHDLRSPLLTISNFTSVLTEDHAKDFSDEARGIVQRIHRASIRMEALLKNLVQYSRLTRTPVAYETVDLQEIFRELRLEHAAFIATRAAEVRISTPFPKVLGSRTLIALALGHVFTNALKFTGPEKSPVVQLSAKETDRTLVITIADEGIGIAPEHHERIFRVFGKVNREADYPGTGIGLALARRAVERMHGRIWVESQPGQGAKFFVELPKTPASS